MSIRVYAFSFFFAPSVLVSENCCVFSQAESLRKNTTIFTREVRLRTDMSNKKRTHKPCDEHARWLRPWCPCPSPCQDQLLWLGEAFSSQGIEHLGQLTSIF